MVINVVKNAFRSKPVTFHRPRTGSVSAFQLGRIVTLRERLCKSFLHTPPLKCCGAINKEIGTDLFSAMVDQNLKKIYPLYIIFLCFARLLCGVALKIL